MAAANVQIYRTDKDGTIVASSDGKSIVFNKTKVSTPATPVPTTKPTPISSGQTANKNVAITSIDLVGEIVTITNKANTNVDMTGWKLVSIIGNQTYNFPAGFTLKAGASVKVTSGSRAYSNGTSALKWTMANIWNNDGDPGRLYNSDGTLVSSK